MTHTLTRRLEAIISHLAGIGLVCASFASVALILAAQR